MKETCRKGWTWPKEGGCGSQCSGLNLLRSSLLCPAAALRLRPVCIAVVHQHQIRSARSDAACWRAAAGCARAECVLLLEGCQHIHRCVSDCNPDASPCSWLCRHRLCQGGACMQDASHLHHLTAVLAQRMQGGKQMPQSVLLYLESAAQQKEHWPHGE